MKKLKYILLGAISYVVAVFLLTGYGNVSSHIEINQLIIQKFNEVFINTAFPNEQFKNTLLVSTKGIVFPGSFIENGALFQSNLDEKQKELNPWSWISHGGFSADEPEIFASFRHFYDPTAPEGKRYLHNLLDEFEKKGVINNPRIDHLNWTQDVTEHIYNWENGKEAIIAALQTDDKDLRDKKMGFAWRSLGETLHMIADMGCPAHVRDDAHPTESITGYNLGSQDPYEEIFEMISREKGAKIIYDAGKTDTELKRIFKKATTLKEIAHEMAVYTNKNFFTHQTISGKDISPIIHPEKTYTSPTLEQCEYDDEEFTYYKQISGNKVKMCRDLKYSYGIFKNRGYPYIDSECTYSQAQALLPQIVEAGINVMRLYIPEMKVEIKNIDLENNELSVKVIHKTNNEYPHEIKYDGKITFYNAYNKKILAEFECEDGILETEFRKSDFSNVNWENYGVFAEIDYGGLFVKSEPFLAKEEEFSGKFKYYSLEVGITFKNLYQSEQERFEQDRFFYLDADNEIRTEGNIIRDSSEYFGSNYYVTITMDKKEVESIEIKQLLYEDNYDWDKEAYSYEEFYFKSIPFPFKNGNTKDLSTGLYCEINDGDLIGKFTYKSWGESYGKSFKKDLISADSCALKLSLLYQLPAGY